MLPIRRVTHYGLQMSSNQSKSKSEFIGNASELSKKSSTLNQIEETLRAIKTHNQVLQILVSKVVTKQFRIEN
ncbi:hypothetical protein FGO68_gene5160 [Halteria grandinella]|uniref:Uncharacterized protein n=1 Tax=Halteria grandinella TaxID=5974 RepID=A0A8J8P025_HALGN|nr:hypothetical protein FGO68_gene5160 [Halteria grandinella]